MEKFIKKSGCGKMKIDKNRLDKYSITATVLTSRIILSFMSAHTLIFYLRAQCVCGYSVDTLRLLLFRQTCIFARGGVPEKAVMPHGIVREDG